ncbi:hypothetical protein F5877DRAFT_81205 [Lentinula edodes]|nr:hypothetical protein F5877DRAFT_81205 [Lentinula edodes]
MTQLTGVFDLFQIFVWFAPRAPSLLGLEIKIVSCPQCMIQFFEQFRHEILSSHENVLFYATAQKEANDQKRKLTGASMPSKPPNYLFLFRSMFTKAHLEQTGRSPTEEQHTHAVKSLTPEERLRLKEASDCLKKSWNNSRGERNKRPRRDLTPDYFQARNQSVRRRSRRRDQVLASPASSSSDSFESLPSPSSSDTPFDWASDSESCGSYQCDSFKPVTPSPLRANFDALPVSDMENDGYLDRLQDSAAFLALPSTESHSYTGSASPAVNHTRDISFHNVSSTALDSVFALCTCYAAHDEPQVWQGHTSATNTPFQRYSPAYPSAELGMSVANEYPKDELWWILFQRAIASDSDNDQLVWDQDIRALERYAASC